MKNGKQSKTMEHSLARCEVRSLCEGSQRQGLHHCEVTSFPVRLGSDRLKPKNAWRAVVCFCFSQRNQTWTLHSTTCRMWHCTDGVRWRNRRVLDILSNNSPCLMTWNAYVPKMLPRLWVNLELYFCYWAVTCQIFQWTDPVHTDSLCIHSFFSNWICQTWSLGFHFWDLCA